MVREREEGLGDERELQEGLTQGFPAEPAAGSGEPQGRARHGQPLRSPPISGDRLLYPLKIPSGGECDIYEVIVMGSLRVGLLEQLEDSLFSSVVGEVNQGMAPREVC